MLILIGEVMVATALAATYIKSDAGDKLVVVTETTTELTPAEIDHEIDGIQKDLERIESAKQPFLDRLAKYQEMKDSCVSMDIKPITKDDKIITKPTKGPDGL
jgi:vacuolar-type H+-ATPase catalytic subunit A/Vma1